MRRPAVNSRVVPRNSTTAPAVGRRRPGRSSRGRRRSGSCRSVRSSRCSIVRILPAADRRDAGDFGVRRDRARRRRRTRCRRRTARAAAAAPVPARRSASALRATGRPCAASGSSTSTVSRPASCRATANSLHVERSCDDQLLALGRQQRRRPRASGRRPAPAA